MIIINSYSDGSQKVQLDDGKVVILSSPYSNGERKMYSESFQELGWLSDRYSDGNMVARLSDGSEYRVSEKSTLFHGNQEMWEKVRQGRTNELSEDEQNEVRATLATESRNLEKEEAEQRSQNEWRQTQDQQEQMIAFLLMKHQGHDHQTLRDIEDCERFGYGWDNYDEDDDDSGDDEWLDDNEGDDGYETYKFLLSQTFDLVNKAQDKSHKLRLLYEFRKEVIIIKPIGWIDIVNILRKKIDIIEKNQE